MNAREAYETLELPFDSPLEEAEKAYRQLTRVWHPDRYQNDNELKEKCVQKQQKLNDAIEALREYFATGHTGYASDSETEDRQGGNEQRNTTVVIIDFGQLFSILKSAFLIALSFLVLVALRIRSLVVELYGSVSGYIKGSKLKSHKRLFIKVVLFLFLPLYVLILIIKITESAQRKEPIYSKTQPSRLSNKPEVNQRTIKVSPRTSAVLSPSTVTSSPSRKNTDEVILNEQVKETASPKKVIQTKRVESGAKKKRNTNPQRSSKKHHKKNLSEVEVNKLRNAGSMFTNIDASKLSREVLGILSVMFNTSPDNIKQYRWGEVLGRKNPQLVDADWFTVWYASSGMNVTKYVNQDGKIISK